MVNSPRVYIPIDTGVLEFHDKVVLRSYTMRRPVCFPAVIQRKVQIVPPYSQFQSSTVNHGPYMFSGKFQK